MVETGGKATLLVRGGGLYLGFINGVEFDIILDPIYRNQEGAERGHWRSRGPSRLGGGAPLHNVYVLIDAMQQEVSLTFGCDADVHGAMHHSDIR